MEKKDARVMPVIIIKDLSKTEPEEQKQKLKKAHQGCREPEN